MRSTTAPPMAIPAIAPALSAGLEWEWLPDPDDELDVDVAPAVPAAVSEGKGSPGTIWVVVFFVYASWTSRV